MLNLHKTGSEIKIYTPVISFVRSLLMKYNLVIITIIFLTSIFGQNIVTEIDPGIYYVVTGGHWESNDMTGQYRIIIYNRGWEHISSEIFIQWLSADQTKQEIGVISSVRINELSEGLYSTGIPKFLLNNRKETYIEINLTNTYTLDEKICVITVPEIGKYLISWKK